MFQCSVGAPDEDVILMAAVAAPAASDALLGHPMSNFATVEGHSRQQQQQQQYFTQKKRLLEQQLQRQLEQQHSRRLLEKPAPARTPAAGPAAAAGLGPSEPLLPASCALLQSIFEMQFAYHRQKLLAERELFLRDQQLQLSLHLLQSVQQRLQSQQMPLTAVTPTAFNPAVKATEFNKQQQIWGSELVIQQQLQTLLLEYENFKLLAHRQQQQQVAPSSAFRAYCTTALGDPPVEYSEEENATHTVGLHRRPIAKSFKCDVTGQPPRQSAGEHAAAAANSDGEGDEEEERSRMPRLLPEYIAFEALDCGNSSAAPPPLDAFDDSAVAIHRNTVVYAPLSIDCDAPPTLAAVLHPDLPAIDGANRSALVNFVAPTGFPTPSFSLVHSSECMSAGNRPPSVIVITGERPVSDTVSDRLLSVCHGIRKNPDSIIVSAPAESSISNDPSIGVVVETETTHLQKSDNDSMPSVENEVTAQKLELICPTVIQSNLKCKRSNKRDHQREPKLEPELVSKGRFKSPSDIRDRILKEKTQTAEKMSVTVTNEWKKLAEIQEKSDTLITVRRVNYASDMSDSSRISIAESMKLEERRVPLIRLHLATPAVAPKKSKREPAATPPLKKKLHRHSDGGGRRPVATGATTRKRKRHSLSDSAEIVEVRDGVPTAKKPAHNSRRRHTVGAATAPRVPESTCRRRRHRNDVSRLGAALKIVSNWRPLNSGRQLRLAGELHRFRGRCFSAVRHWSELDEIVRVNDCVRICSAEGLENIGKIVRFYYDKPSKAIMATVLWYYTQIQVETTHGSPRIVMHNKELLASKHADTVNADCIEGIVYVLTYNEYSRFAAESRMRGLPIESRPAELDVFWTRAEDAYPRRSMLPLEDTPSDLVYFCRAMYSIKTRKIYHSIYTGSYSTH